MSESAFSKIKFYTTSYAGQDINNLKLLLKSVDAILVDVRLFPASSDIIYWRQVYLNALLHNKYRHISQLGSRADRAGRSQIQHLNLGLKILLSFQTNAVLMCGCSNEAKDCHRFIIAGELRSRGFEIEEITDWKKAVFL